MSIQTELREFLLEKGVSDVGFFAADDGPLPFGVSIAVRLSEEIIDEIEDEPTHTYFNHYRNVNAFIDAMLLQAGLFLQRKGKSQPRIQRVLQECSNDRHEPSGRHFSAHVLSMRHTYYHSR